MAVVSLVALEALAETPEASGESVVVAEAASEAWVGVVLEALE